MKAQHIPGVAVAVVRDGKPIKVRGYGAANLALEAPVTPDSVFFIGSLSKQIIAVAVMKLVQEGRLALDGRRGAASFRIYLMCVRVGSAEGEGQRGQARCHL